MDERKPRAKKATKVLPVSAQPAVPAIIKERKELVLEGDPEQQLAFAQKAAKTLMKWVEQKPKKVMIRGEQYLEFGDWQIIGRFYGATVGIEWTKPIEKGWEARAIVTRDSIVIASAEAMCTRVEKNWKDRDEFMLKSMAQTRASAKALRQAFGWVAELAGMKSTPAEEMDGVGGHNYDQTPIKEEAIPVVTYDDPETPPAEMTVVEKKQRIASLLQRQGVDIKDLKACKTFVADVSQLDLVESNYVEIIKVLERM